MIEPFQIPVNEDECAWIRQRVVAHRFIPEPQGADWAYGASRAYMEKLRWHWLYGYDWNAAVAGLNRHPHFRATMDGRQLHFIHRRSSRADARPLLLIHGWPGSVFEFAHLIDRLAEPESPDQPAFHVVAPSLPGYAWSDAPERPMGPRAIAGLYDRLMTEVLGYNGYIAQGGDWGCVISAWIGLDSSSVGAIHLSGFGLACPDMTPETDRERRWLAAIRAMRRKEFGYYYLQSTKPQSLGYAMMDSPMGTAAWIVEKFCAWSSTFGPTGEPPFTLDQMLTNIMIYLTTRSFVTATWLYAGYAEEKQPAIPPRRRITVPVGVAAFPNDLLGFPPRSMVERGYNVTRWTDMPGGGHFASLEEPELYLREVRAFAASLAGAESCAEPAHVSINSMN